MGHVANPRAHLACSPSSDDRLDENPQVGVGLFGSVAFDADP